MTKTKSQFSEHRQLALSDKLQRWRNGDIARPDSKSVYRKIDGVEIKPNVKGIHRTHLAELSAKDILPIEVKRSGLVLYDRIKVPSQINTIDGRVDDANFTFPRVSGLMQPEYNLLEPYTIYDTEPIVRQAIARKRALAFRNGFEIVGDSTADVEYIERRLETMEYVTEKDTQSFLTDIFEVLQQCSNCFLQKIRSADATFVTQKEDRGVPVAGYRIIPSYLVFPYLQDGILIKWRRFFETGAPWVDINPEDMVHLFWDRKPGHRFGCPRTVGVKEDILALRRLEENVELLFINHLFPLFHVKVGTEENPASAGPNGELETDMIRWEIENMPKEGVFVTDERVEVDVVGAQGKGLDPKAMIEHYKSRIYTGLGMSALDMGDGKNANRATADNISQNLKDSIKADLEIFGGVIRLQMFKEFFREANYSVSIQKATARTKILFHEIDLDNKIKFENHVIQLFLNNLLDEDEARKLIGQKAFTEVQRKKLHFDLHVVRLVKETANAQAQSAIKIQEGTHEMQMEALEMQTQHQAQQADTEKGLLKAKTEHSEQTSGHKVTVLKAKTAHIKAGGGAPQRATEKKSSPGAKAIQNKETPTNQHKTNTGPMKAQSSLEESAAEFTDALSNLTDTLLNETEVIDISDWRQKSAEVIDLIAERLIGNGEVDENSYTSQDRTRVDHLKALIATTWDPELISVLVQSTLSNESEKVLAEDE